MTSRFERYCEALLSSTIASVETVLQMLVSLSGLEPSVPSQAAAILARSGPLLNQIDEVLLPLLNGLAGSSRCPRHSAGRATS